MNEVFICYRRADSEVVTGRIYDHVSNVFGDDHVFKDVDSIPAGKDFRAEIDRAIGSTKCVVAIIGKDWLEQDKQGRTRINRHDDYVRAEIQSALDCGIPIIPVLVERNEMPSPDSLEGDLKRIAFLNAIAVRADPDFKSDVNRLAKRIGEIANLSDARDKSHRLLTLSMIGIVMAGLVGWFGYKAFFGTDPPPLVEPTKIRVGLKQWVGYTPLGVAKELDLFPNDIEVVFHDVTSVSDMNRDLENGDIDVSLGLVETHVRAAQLYIGRESAANPNRPVAFLKLDTSLGADGIVARKEIRTIADLGLTSDGIERRFLFQNHDVSHFLFLALCKEHSNQSGQSQFRFRDLKAFGDNRNVQAAANLFDENPGDRYYAVGTYEPYMSSMLKQDGNHPLVHSGSPIVRGLVVDIMVTKKEFLDENRNAIRSLVKGWFAATELLNKKENASEEVLDLAYKFNGTTRDGAPWSFETWTTNIPCAADEYSLYLAGLTDDESETPWPTIEENRDFFQSWDGHPSKFERVFDKCKEHREGKDLSELIGHTFQAFSDVMPGK